MPTRQAGLLELRIVCVGHALPGFGVVSAEGAQVRARKPGCPPVLEVVVVAICLVLVSRRV